MHWWMTQQVAEEHRRDLRRPARGGVRRDAAARDHRNPMTQARTEAPTDPVGRDRLAVRQIREDGVPRRAIAPSVGAWLIRLGTRLGGASMRTS